MMQFNGDLFGAYEKHDIMNISFVIILMRKSVNFFHSNPTLLSCKDSARAVSTMQSGPTQQHQFYQDFQNTNKLKSCAIETIEIIPGTTFSRSYALYIINVVTSDVQYSIKRRFSDFQKFYINSRAELRLEMSFPPKTFFMPGWAQQVTCKRKTWLNDIIQELLSSDGNQEVKFSFFDFIQLFDHYRDEGIIEYCRACASESEIILTDEELIEKVVILNHQPINSLTIVQQIRGALFNRRKRVSYGVAKEVLSGSAHVEGLISVVLNNQNPLIVVEGLQLLLEFFSPETNRDSELFLRVLSKFLPSQLELWDMGLLQSDTLLKVSYFQLMRFYGLGRGQSAVKAVFEGFEEGDMQYRQYLIWQRLRRWEGLN